MHISGLFSSFIDKITLFQGLVSHLIYAPRYRSEDSIKPLDVFLINTQLSAFTGEREGLPSVEALASARRKAQLEVIFNGIVSRYNEWRQQGYPLRGSRRSPMESETFDRWTPIWILSGSFNFTPDSEEYGFIIRMNFVDAVPHKGTGTKSHGLGETPTLTLDYVFAGPRFVAMNPLVREGAFHGNRVELGTSVSDHHPMVVTVPLEIQFARWAEQPSHDTGRLTTE